jgi:hypothetical protein
MSRGKRLWVKKAQGKRILIFKYGGKCKAGRESPLLQPPLAFVLEFGGFIKILPKIFSTLTLCAALN